MPSETPKYMFDLHNFDAGSLPDEPQEPVFSAADLDRARKEGYDEGYKKAASDGQASRDAQLVDLTGRMTRDLQNLFTAEGARAQKFQTELVKTLSALFGQAFPMINMHHGLDQIAAAIHQIFENLGPQSAVHVDVAPEDLEDISQRLRPYLTSMDTQFHINARSDMPAGSFELRWQDGGAIRDTDKLKHDILAAIERTLAESSETTHTSP